MPRRAPILTAARLEAANACREQVALFRETFGESAAITRANWRKALAAGLDTNWSVHLLDAPALAAYHVADASAWEAYRAAIAPAWEAYRAADASAWEARDAAIAGAWEARDAAIAGAWGAYRAAIAPALFNALLDTFARSED